MSVKRQQFWLPVVFEAGKTFLLFLGDVIIIEAVLNYNPIEMHSDSVFRK